MMFLPLLRLIRNRLASDVTILMASSYRSHSTIHTMESRVLYRKWGLIWDCSASSSLRRLASCSTTISSISLRIWLTMDWMLWPRLSIS